jgi:hypothetical protein
MGNAGIIAFFGAAAGAAAYHFTRDRGLVTPWGVFGATVGFVIVACTSWM